ncbi:MAG: hypothetical protein LC130_28820 [Bryobacterales bacterium]|nr:hypothetical protein [Bryobacterales bacterium]
MSFEKGWINRQFARIERDAENWPSWMRREVDIRAASEGMKPDWREPVMVETEDEDE